MGQKHWSRRLAAGLLLGTAVFALAGCGPTGAADSEAEDLALFELHPLEGYERADGTIDEREEELPFDLNADIIDISDADYALWFMDAMDNPKKYDHKKVRFLALVYNPADGKLRRNVFVPGRFAMTCCVEDITFLGMKCKSDQDR